MTTDPHRPGSDEMSLLELVDRLDNGLRQLAQRVDEHEHQILDTLESLATELDTLRDELDGKTTTSQTVTPKRPGDATPPDSDGDSDTADEPPIPLRWAARATPEDWDQLVTWVDALRNVYSLSTDHIVQPCWPAHPGVVEELAGLHRAWVSAVLTDEQASAEGNSALTAWHDRWLWPALQRFKSTNYRITNCRQNHVAEGFTTLRPTDQAYLPAQPDSAPRFAGL